MFFLIFLFALIHIVSSSFTKMIFPNIYTGDGCDSCIVGIKRNSLININLQYINNSFLNDTFNANSQNKDPLCTPQCYLNCKIHFQTPLESKYCILNVCHCDFVDEEPIQTETNPQDTSIDQNTQNTQPKEAADPKIFLKKPILNENGNIMNAFIYFILFIFGAYEVWVFYYFNSNNKNRNEGENIPEDTRLYQKLLEDDYVLFEEKKETIKEK